MNLLTGASLLALAKSIYYGVRRNQFELRQICRVMVIRIQALPRPLPHLLQVLWLLHLCACISTAETGNTQWKFVQRVEAMATSMGCSQRGDRPSK